MRLFVYGTLRPGGRFWEQIADLVSAVGSTGTLTGYRLIAGPSYPLATPAPDGEFPTTGVVGEPVEVDDAVAGQLLAITDTIEGAPELFGRVEVAGMWCYLATPQTLVEVGGTPVASGDWFDVDPSAREAWEAALAMPYVGPTCRYGPP